MAGAMSLVSSVLDFPLFKRREEKERFLLVLGLLTARSITLAKAAEFMDMSRDEFGTVLRSLGAQYSFLDEDEAARELETAKRLGGALR